MYILYKPISIFTRRITRTYIPTNDPKYKHIHMYICGNTCSLSQFSYRENHSQVGLELSLRSQVEQSALRGRCDRLGRLELSL